MRAEKQLRYVSFFPYLLFASNITSVLLNNKQTNFCMNSFGFLLKAGPMKINLLSKKLSRMNLTM